MASNFDQRSFIRNEKGSDIKEPQDASTERFRDLADNGLAAAMTNGDHRP